MSIDRAPDARRYTLLHPWVTNETHAVLAAEAERRGVQVDRFAAQLLELIARDELIAAVIDVEITNDPARKR